MMTTKEKSTHSKVGATKHNDDSITTAIAIATVEGIATQNPVVPTPTYFEQLKDKTSDVKLPCWAKYTSASRELIGSEMLESFLDHIDGKQRNIRCQVVQHIEDLYPKISLEWVDYTRETIGDTSALSEVKTVRRVAIPVDAIGDMVTNLQAVADLATSIREEIDLALSQCSFNE